MPFADVQELDLKNQITRIKLHPHFLVEKIVDFTTYPFGYTIVLVSGVATIFKPAYEYLHPPCCSRHSCHHPFPLVTTVISTMKEVIGFREYMLL